MQTNSRCAQLFEVLDERRLLAVAQAARRAQRAQPHAR